ncbi:hypothetical protein QOT17_017626 [Balamuthia mandrillaris]
METQLKEEEDSHTKEEEEEDIQKKRKEQLFLKVRPPSSFNLKKQVDLQEKSIQALPQKQNTNQASRPSAILQEKKQPMEQCLQQKAIQFIANTPKGTKAEKEEVFEEVLEELLLEEKVVLCASLKQIFKNKLKNFRFGLAESVCTESRKLG